MSMSGDNIDKLYYSTSNLDNTFKQVAEEVMRRTNKDILKNGTYKTSFNTMAKMVYDKCLPADRNLMNINNRLIDKSVSYFHGKIFNKNINNPTEKQSSKVIQESAMSKAISMASMQTGSSSTNTQHGFTMMNDNENLSNKYNEIMALRETGSGGGNGNPNTYLPQPMIKSGEYVKNEKFVRGSNESSVSYENQFLRVADDKSKMKNKEFDFKVNPFNLNEDLTDSLIGSENVDSPLYQNIENLQRMEGTNPMSMLDDYQKQRNQQVQMYSDVEQRQNITAMKTQSVKGVQYSQASQSQHNLPASHNIINNDKASNQTNNLPRYTDAQTNIEQIQVDPMELYNLGKKLTDHYSERIEERIVNDNNAQPNVVSPKELSKMQDELVKMQRDTQPKYIDKVHYININSVDRQWEQNEENRFSFKVLFNQNSTFTGASISQLYRNIVSVELVSAILPMDTAINTFDTRIYGGLMKYPYLLLRIDELDSVFRGTNDWADRAFSTLLFDKVYFTNTLSTDYISGYTTGTPFTSVVNSAPRTSFAPEYLRGFMKFNPAYFEKKKFYNNPLASLSRMTITITDPRGNFINTQNDVLAINAITFTDPLDVLALNAGDFEINPTFAFPYAAQSTYKMIKIASTTVFSNRLFRIGDKILIRDFTMTNAGTDNGKFVAFITRSEGHTIINLDVEINEAVAGVTNNKSFIQNMYISPEGTFDNTTKAVTGYYHTTNLNFGGAVYGTLINMDLQSHLLFRIVTREVDTSGTLQPINVY